MNAPEMASTGTTDLFNKIIERGILFLLIFTPLAFGTVQSWSIAVMEIAAFIVFGAWLLNRSMMNDAGALKSRVLFFAGAIICLVVLQLVPMPRFLLAAFSPSTVSLYDRFSGADRSVWSTISIHPDATIEELYKLLAYTAVFIVILHHYRKQEQVLTVLRTIAFMGCFLAVFAVVQKMTWNGKLYWIYSVAVSSARDYGWGPYINHNHFAGYMEMSIPIALGLLIHQSSRVATRSQKSFVGNILIMAGKKEGFRAALLSAGVILMSGALFLSLSRGAAIGFLASMLLFAVMTRARRSLQKKSAIIFLIGFAVFMTAVAANWDRIESRFGELGQKGRFLRTSVWADSIGIIRDFPALGTGLGTFRDIYPHYQTKYANVFFEHAENDYVEILTDTGVAGLMLATGAAAAFFFSVLTRWKARHRTFIVAMGAAGVCSCAAIAVHSAVDFNLRVPANAMTLTIIAAVTFATVANVGNGEA